MGQQVLNLLRLIIPLALEQMSVQSPFVYDLLPESGEAVHRPSALNLYSPGPTVWDWNMQDANGTTWRWETPQGTWFTWFWTADRPTSDHGGGFRLRQLDDGDTWAELSWVHVDQDLLRWFCRLRNPDTSRGETPSSVSDLRADPWRIRSGDHAWGLVRRRPSTWSFCTDEACVPVDEESCNGSVRAVRPSQDGVDAVEWEVPSGGDYRVLNVRLRRHLAREPRDTSSFLSDMVDSVVNFFRRLFGADSARDGQESAIIKLISAIISLFSSGKDPAVENTPPKEGNPTTPAPEDLL